MGCPVRCGWRPPQTAWRPAGAFLAAGLRLTEAAVLGSLWDPNRQRLAGLQRLQRPPWSRIGHHGHPSHRGRCSHCRSRKDHRRRGRCNPCSPASPCRRQVQVLGGMPTSATLWPPLLQTSEAAQVCSLPQLEMALPMVAQRLQARTATGAAAGSNLGPVEHSGWGVRCCRAWMAPCQEPTAWPACWPRQRRCCARQQRWLRPSLAAWRSAQMVVAAAPSTRSTSGQKAASAPCRACHGLRRRLGSQLPLLTQPLGPHCPSRAALPGRPPMGLQTQVSRRAGRGHVLAARRTALPGRLRHQKNHRHRRQRRLRRRQFQHRCQSRSLPLSSSTSGAVGGAAANGAAVIWVPA
mmetsp:Transcript_66682/g.214824  ORF Transcript_66682/g.214824 Transcript_66682/m.214824 type:complete len:351 (+) Transcript_66682:1322-2374(+)